MKVSANVATYPGREKALALMLESIKGQFDVVRVYHNECKDCSIVSGSIMDHVFDYTTAGNNADNGKFYALDIITEPEIYCTLDDDLRYPPNYREQLEKAVNEFGCIVSYHGRRIHGTGFNFYKGTTQFPCLGTVHESEIIDVVGTGVCAFDTRYFHPKGLADSPDLRMSDLVFSLEAAKQGKQMGVLKHDVGWIKYLGREGVIKETIYETESRKGCKRQNEIADEIYKLRYE